MLLPSGLHVVASLSLAAVTGMVLYAGTMQVLAPETLAAALVLFRRRRNLVE